MMGGVIVSVELTHLPPFLPPSSYEKDLQQHRENAARFEEELAKLDARIQGLKPTLKLDSPRERCEATGHRRGEGAREGRKEGEEEGGKEGGEEGGREREGNHKIVALVTQAF